eukprot:TRINITY_DN32994_c0_g1_i2.p1 TRINITY_DN32994_c0_g1~~TRINITY_DN32994_c0_g1_i2.p1  ORF type:complete len:435 (-),score=35.54 TRINITY_DN32994_c0_g1_i2:429-1733(-)
MYRIIFLISLAIVLISSKSEIFDGSKASFRKLLQEDKFARVDFGVCDDMPPKGSLENCSFYADHDLCDPLDHQYCRKSCLNCCYDILLPGVSCEYFVRNGICFDEVVMSEGYCRSTCGQCTISNTSISGTEILALNVLLNLVDDTTYDGDAVLTWVGNDICEDWEGVNCEDGHVVELKLPFTYLDIPIPPELSLLTELRELELEDADLFGTIPPELTVLTNLVFLNLDDNDLTGTLPDFLSTLSNLQMLALSGNKITGTIPSSYSTMVNMSEFYVDYVETTGSLPPSLSTWQELTIFDIRNAEHFGTLPPEYSTWVNLVDIDISSNYISGTLPPEYSTWAKLVDLDISYNYISGTLPPEYSTWVNIEDGDFDIDYNDIEGVIPVEYLQLLVNTSVSIYGNERLCIEVEVFEFFTELEGGTTSNSDEFAEVPLCD